MSFDFVNSEISIFLVSDFFFKFEAKCSQIILRKKGNNIIVQNQSM